MLIKVSSQLPQPSAIVQMDTKFIPASPDEATAASMEVTYETDNFQSLLQEFQIKREEVMK